MKALTTREQMDFLTALKMGNSVKTACEKTGVNRRRAYYFRAEDPEFDEAWKDAISDSVEELEDHLRVRALDSEDSRSHLLLMFLLKKINPEYRDNYKSETKKAVAQTTELEFDPAEIDKAMKILDAAKKRSALTDKATAPQDVFDE